MFVTVTYEIAVDNFLLMCVCAEPTLVAVLVTDGMFCLVYSGYAWCIGSLQSAWGCVCSSRPASSLC